MAKTIIGLGDSKAVKKYSAFLAVDLARKAYWTRKFTGKGSDSSMPLQLLKELESDAGEYISFDLSMQMSMTPVEGDDVLENKEEALSFYTDGVYIDQMRCGVNTGGRMSRKRTMHKLREVARRRQSDWWARAFDELCFIYASGARGVNADFIYPTSYTGFANNSLSVPDSSHILYAGGHVKATITSSDIMDTGEIDKMVALAEMMGGGTEGTPQIQPIKIDGEDHYVLVMNPWQAYSLRTGTSTGDWLDIQKAAATAEGRKSPIFTGALGMHNNVVLHKHKGVIKFSDYGTGSPGTLKAARALFLGEQALVAAFGSPGSGFRFGWNEETRDNGNQVVISSNSIFGIKKVTFNSLDYGIMALDTYSPEP
jgi:N4-gp56 family major capsid protein